MYNIPIYLRPEQVPELKVEGFFRFNEDVHGFIKTRQAYLGCVPVSGKSITAGDLISKYTGYVTSRKSLVERLLGPRPKVPDVETILSLVRANVRGDRSDLVEPLVRILGQDFERFDEYLDEEPLLGVVEEAGPFGRSTTSPGGSETKGDFMICISKKYLSRRWFAGMTDEQFVRLHAGVDRFMEAVELESGTDCSLYSYRAFLALDDLCKDLFAQDKKALYYLTLKHVVDAVKLALKGMPVDHSILIKLSINMSAYQKSN